MESLAVLTSRMGLARLLTRLETLRYQATDLDHHLRPVTIFLVVVGLIVWCNRARATSARGQGRDRRLSEARREAPKCDPSEEDVSSRSSSQNLVTDSDVSEVDIPPSDPLKEDVLPSNPFNHSLVHSDPSEQGILPSLLSENGVADSDPYEEDISAISQIRQHDPTDNPIKQDILSKTPSEHSDTDGHALEQKIPDSLLSENDISHSDLPKEEDPSTSTPKKDVLSTNPPKQETQPMSLSVHGNTDGASVEQDIPDKGHTENSDAKAEKARKMSRILDQHEKVLGEIQKGLIGNGATWFYYSDLVLTAPGDPLRPYNLFRDGKSGGASPILQILKGPINYIPPTSPVTRETNGVVVELIEAYEVITDGIEQGLVRDPPVVKTAFKVNASALRSMIEAASDGDSSNLSKIDSLLEFVDLNNNLILQQGTLIDNILANLANLITKCQDGVDDLVIMATADHLIALTKVPYGWETLEAKSGSAEWNQGPGQRRQGTLTGALRSNAITPADIVENVYELSQAFRRGSKEIAKPTSEAVVRGMPHAEEMKRLLKAKEDLEKLRIRIERMQDNCEAPRADQEATVKGQESQITAKSALYRLIRRREPDNLN